MKSYDHRKIEKKWRDRWEEDKIYQPNINKARKPYFNLMMFPYPSAEGLHVGNMYAFTGSDIWGRYKRMKGYDVLEPIGLDGFGIHSENYAIKIGEHIRDVSKRTEKHFYKQLKMTGNQYDWSRKLETYDPEYYKWTQWLFIEMFKHGLAYRKKATVNWCPSCKTVLSDEQVEGGICERCKSESETREMEQWFWRITDYAERLLENLEWINWSEEVIVGQRNWIGKSEGIDITYNVKGSKETITCFTSYPETNFGATFVVLASEHALALRLTTDKHREKVENYIAETKKKSDIERIAEGRKKTGVFTGSYCINQLTGKEMPIYVTDFVLANVGTGAVIGVPGHDLRDYQFAIEFGLEIIRVMKTYDGDESKINSEDKVNHEGIIVNSDFINGLDHKEARKKIMKYIVKKGWGERKVHYKLRDWCISRQRYWGDPIPMINCKKCGWQTVHKKSLPVLLPDIPEFKDILPDGSGKGPLARRGGFVNVKCPKCCGKAQRETDVMDPFVDSSWYFLRYPSVGLSGVPFDKKRIKKWLPVNMYIGGKEHTVLHLLYSRFVTMALKDWGYIDFEEPFTRFFGHGLLIKEGSKMSKSKGNVINPDEYIEKYGADAVRMYLMFLGDFKQGGDWRDSGMNGMYKFIKKVWQLQDEPAKYGGGCEDKSMIHRTIKGVEKDIKNIRYNTAIAKIMEYVNWYKDKETLFTKQDRKFVLEVLCLIIAPFTPYLAEELWERLGNEYSIHLQAWPSYDEKLIDEDEVTIAVQINGKLRDTIRIQKNATKKEVIERAKKSEKIKKYLKNVEKRVVYVKNKVLNFVL